MRPRSVVVVVNVVVVIVHIGRIYIFLHYHYEIHFTNINYMFVTHRGILNIGKAIKLSSQICEEDLK